MRRHVWWEFGRFEGEWYTGSVRLKTPGRAITVRNLCEKKRKCKEVIKRAGTWKTVVMV